MPEPSDSDLKDHYKSISSRFALPEFRSIEVLQLDKKSLGVDTSKTANDAQKYYDEHKADYTKPETRVVSQAVANDEETAKTIYQAALKTKDMQKAAAAAGRARPTISRRKPSQKKDMPLELSPPLSKARRAKFCRR